MNTKFLKRVLGDPQAATIKRLKKRVEQINKLGPKYEKMTNAQLKKQTAVFKEQLSKGKKLDDILPEAFAAVREAATRTLKQRHFDVQLIGGMVLFEGKVSEMKTGEGKTLVATLPMYLNALEGKGAHLVTVNDYLVQRDAGWMGQIYDFLGLSVGVIIPEESFIYDASFENKKHFDKRLSHLKPTTRQAAYAADITYATNNELGFDYLRDNMVREVDQLRQRKLHFAIVDEVDSILIDEARTPLIISAPSSASGASYGQFARIARQLVDVEDYEKDEKRKQVFLTDAGVEKIQKILGIKNLYANENLRMIYHLDQALKAEALFHRDKNYVVTQDGEVVIVDEFTGRLLRGRRYNEGLHQAIEAKEGVEVQEESMTLATISFQNYFRLYKKLAGMTGTAKTEEEEFHQVYKMDVVEVPTNKPTIRDDKPDRIYKTEAGKFNAIVREVKELQAKGQPVLLGTVSVEKNEQLSQLLREAGIKHETLNAKNNEHEAAIVAKAGTRGAVTLATNIAGRGTDIVLGDGVRELGGLFVLGSERHEARRIDNQLRGRTGRQGDPGASQFYVSCQDDLMRIFGGERIAGVMDRLHVAEDEPIENKIISRTLEASQKKVEGFSFDTRKNVVQYDDVMNRQRKAVYTMRREILESIDVAGRVKALINEESDIVANHPEAASPNYETILKDIFPLSEKALDKLFAAEGDKFSAELKTAAAKLYESKEKTFGVELLRQVERNIYLEVLDSLWMQHLENMEHLREGIHWMGIGQRDPLVEYRRRGQVIFDEMLATLRHEVVRNILSAEPVNEEALARAVETELTLAARGSVENAGQITQADEFSEEDFNDGSVNLPAAKKKKTIKKSRKKERMRKKVSRNKRRHK